MMGGNIWVSSVSGEGSVFSFTIQIKRAADAPGTLSGLGVNLRNARILVVDDDPDVLLYFREILPRYALTCDTASCSSEALSLIEQGEPYNIYFLDWMMPEMNGLALADALRSKSFVRDDTVIIMISAVEWRSIEEEARKVGVHKFLPKPLFPSAIADIIIEALGADTHEADKEHPSVAGIFAGRQILLVEDVEINQEIVTSLLGSTGIKIDCAANGLEAVEKFQQAPLAFDLILMDLQMPVMDGYEATAQIRAMDIPNSALIPIIAMTANVFREDVDKCLEVGMNGHVGKPLVYDSLIEKLSEHLL